MQAEHQPSVRHLSRPALAGILLLIVAASVAVYAGTLGNGFVYDDEFQVLKNPWVTDFGYLPTVFSSEVWGFKGAGISNYYRPLMHFFYMLAYKVSGLDPWGFHALNVLFHTGVSLLVFLLTSRLLASAGYRNERLPSLAAALLFATHPIHTEVVAWVAGLPDLSFTFFYLLSFYLYLRAGSAAGYVLSAVPFLLAALSKETALTLPLLLVAYHLVFGRDRITVADLCRRYLPFAAVVAVYFALRINALGSFARVDTHPELTTFQCVINAFPLVAHYLWKLLLPVGLNVKHGFHPALSITEGKVLLSLAVAAGVCLAFYLSARRARVAFVALCILAIPLLPTLYIRAIAFPFGERYLYLPSVGFVLLIALGLARMPAVAGRGTAVIGMVAALGAAYAVGTVHRNTVWKDNVSLWSDTVVKSPDDAIARFNLAAALRAEGRLAEALVQYDAAAELKHDPEMYRRLGRIYSETGQTGKAVAQYLLALKAHPDDYSTHNDLGIVYGGVGRGDQAIEHFRAAVRFNPGYAEAHFNLATALSERGLRDQALPHFQAALSLNPDDAGFRSALAAATRAGAGAGR